MKRSATPPPTRNVRIWSRNFQRALIVPFVVAPLLALFIELKRQPEETQEPEFSVRARALSPFISGMLALPGAAEFECTTEEINTHLAQMLASARKSTTGKEILSCRVQLEPGYCHLITQRLWRDHVFHVRSSYRFFLRSGRLVWEPVSAECGRISLGKAWATRFEGALGRLEPYLRKERILLGRIAELEVEASVVRFRTRPSVSATPGG